MPAALHPASAAGSEVATGMRPPPFWKRGGAGTGTAAWAGGRAGAQGGGTRVVRRRPGGLGRGHGIAARPPTPSRDDAPALDGVGRPADVPAPPPANVLRTRRPLPRPSTPTCVAAASMLGMHGRRRASGCGCHLLWVSGPAAGAGTPRGLLPQGAGRRRQPRAGCLGCTQAASRPAHAHHLASRLAPRAPAPPQHSGEGGGGIVAVDHGTVTHPFLASAAP